MGPQEQRGQRGWTGGSEALWWDQLQGGRLALLGGDSRLKKFWGMGWGRDIQDVQESLAECSLWYQNASVAWGAFQESQMLAERVLGFIGRMEVESAVLRT